MVGDQWRLRPATAADRDFLLDLRLRVMDPHLRAGGIELSADEHAQRVDYRYADTHIIERQGSALGMIKLGQQSDELEVVQLQILPEYQGQGLGAAVMRRIVDDALARQQIITLKVLKHNPALTLYQRLGFEVVDEDALEYHMRYCHHSD
ncbi:MAG: GNAT family N-acetyltransferase [Wenzhouxiangellaceae bacterium]